ncbi:MAG: DUF1820 family protein [Candidatus Lambdaproteobacteria bacterium]|nr:DUF1820 family protein [Candidatus Lambdaproteobacteria bacterium]
MAEKKRDKTYFKVSFTNENELFELCVRTVGPSDIYGMVELAGFIFPEGKLVYNPSEERIKREFAEIRRTFIPYHAIVRIDEVSDSRQSEFKVVPLDPARRPVRDPMLKKPEG